MQAHERHNSKSLCCIHCLWTSKKGLHQSLHVEYYLELCDHDAHVLPGIWSQLCDGALDMVNCTMRLCLGSTLKANAKLSVMGPADALAALLDPPSVLLVLHALCHLSQAHCMMVPTIMITMVTT